MRLRERRGSSPAPRASAACRDLPTLDRWFLRAVTATSTAAVLADN